jgi:hypothetical protein
MIRSLAPFAIALVFAPVWPGCILEPVDFGAHRCPCASGFTCDEATDRCVQGSSGGDGVVRVENLRAAWRTPNSIRWAWTPSAPDNDSLARYELSLLDTVTGETKIFDPSTSPELGFYFIQRSGGAGPVRGMFTSELTPDREYRAVLVATDTGGRTFTSNTAIGRTQIAPIGRIVIVDEDEPLGYELPGAPCYSFTSGDGAHAGTHYIERVHVCVGPSDEEVDDTRCEPNNAAVPQCWANLRTQETALAQDLNENEFELAYLEFAIAIEGSAPSYWSHAGAHLLFADGSRSYPTFEEITFIPERGYVLYQVALDQMSFVHSGSKTPSPITFEDMAGSSFDGYRIGGTFANGARIRVDSVSIRW